MRKHSRHGPVLALHLEELEQPHHLAGAGGHPQHARCVGQHQARRIDVQQVDAVPGEAVQEVEHVEVGDQGVRQVDEGFRELDLARIGWHSTTICAGHPDTSGLSKRSLLSRTSRATSCSGRSSRKARGPQRGERGLDVTAELHHHHAGRLVHRARVGPAGCDPAGQLAGRLPALQLEQHLDGRRGVALRLVDIAGVERARSVPVQVDRAEPDVTGDQGQGERRPRAHLGGRRGEHRPAAGDARLGQVGNEDGLSGLHGVHARPLPEQDLQVLDVPAHPVGGGHLAVPARPAAGHRETDPADRHRVRQQQAEPLHPRGPVAGGSRRLDELANAVAGHHWPSRSSARQPAGASGT